MIGLGFDTYASEQRAKRNAALMRAAKSRDPEIHRLAVEVADLIADVRRVSDPNEHRLSAKQLGVGEGAR